MVAATNSCSSLESFLATCPGMLFIAAADGALLQWSEPLKQVVGSGLSSKRFVDLVHPDDRAAITAAWTRGLSTAEVQTIRFRLPSDRGNHLRLRGVLRTAEGGGFIHGLLDEDTSPMALSEELTALRNKERILNALMDNMAVCVWAIDSQGTFTFYDGKGLERTEFRRHELVGKNIFEIYGSDITNDVRRALTGTFTHMFQELYGAHWESWLVPVRDEDGATSAVVGFTLDVSEGKQAVQELRMKLALIEQQQQVIRDLSTPIIEVWDGVLTLPMVGVVDSVRVSEVTEALLSRIVEKNARFAILDLTGVEVVDTKVASHLVSIVNAIRLLGAEGIVTGIRPTVAQTMVALGLDLSSVVTHANLRAGLSFCIRRMAPAAPRPEPAMAR